MPRKNPRKYTHEDQRQRHLLRVQHDTEATEAARLAKEEARRNGLSARLGRLVNETWEGTKGRVGALRQLIIAHIPEKSEPKVRVELSLPVPETQSLATPDLERSIRGNFRLEKVRILMARGDRIAIDAEAAFLKTPQELEGLGNALILGDRDWYRGSLMQFEKQPAAPSRERRG